MVFTSASYADGLLVFAIFSRTIFLIVSIETISTIVEIAGIQVCIFFLLTIETTIEHVFFVSYNITCKVVWDLLCDFWEKYAWE